MRDTEERMRAALDRAEELKRQDRRRGTYLAAAAVAVCLALVVGAAFAMPVWTAQMAAAPEANGAVTASLFSGSEVLGYLVIGILAFLLGAAVTVLCFRLRNRMQTGDRTA